MSASVTGTHQVSLTEWLAAIGEAAQSEAFRHEDNTKSARLEVLMHEIGLPYRMPVSMPAADALAMKPLFADVLKTRADESVCFRVTPDSPSLPKFRSRGLTAKRCYEEWFKGLDIDFSHYTLSIFPNEQVIDWSMIFVVNQDAVFGEIVRGKHSQLTQGDLEEEPVQFRYDFKDWQWSRDDAAAKAETLETLKTLLVEDPAKRTTLKEKIGAEFSHNYLVGYFECTAPEGKVEYYIDYNQSLVGLIPTPGPLATSSGALKGVTAFAGQATGTVQIVDQEAVSDTNFPDGAILVCENTDVRYLPLMRKSAAIVTAKGGMLSHAAIIARELKVPCLVGVKNATRLLKNGDEVTVDSVKGMVEII